VACSCEHGDELPCSIKGGEFVDQLSDYQLALSCIINQFLMQRSGVKIRFV
jgi:hypothetical protein